MPRCECESTPSIPRKTLQNFEQTTARRKPSPKWHRLCCIEFALPFSKKNTFHLIGSKKKIEKEKERSNPRWEQTSHSTTGKTTDRMRSSFLHKQRKEAAFPKPASIRQPIVHR